MTREEAIRRIKAWNLDSDDREVLAVIIPELAESEDERIRRELMEFVNWAASRGSVRNDWLIKKCPEKWVAYLEKMKENPKSADSILSDCVSDVKWADTIITRVIVALSDDVDYNMDEPCKYRREINDLKKLREVLCGQKEQKPAESISQLTVQGKGVYKICPRCKERMVRDDSMIYTSMPPQYRYECPKCGESECDTVMYDNPEMKEQKPVVTHGETYHVDTLGTQQVIAGKMPHKPAEWSDTKELVFKDICKHLEVEGYSGWVLLLNALRNGEFQPKQEWIEEDEKMLKWLEDILSIADADLSDKLNGEVHTITDSAYSSMKLCIAKCRSWLKSLRPQYHGNVTMTEAYKMGKEAGEASHWKPSEEQMNALYDILHPADTVNRPALESLYEQLKKL